MKVILEKTHDELFPKYEGEDYELRSYQGNWIKVVLDSQLVQQALNVNHRTVANKISLNRYFEKIIRNRKEIKLAQFKRTKEKEDIFILNHFARLNEENDNFIYRVDHRLENLHVVWDRLNAQTKPLYNAKQRLEKILKTKGVLTEKQSYRLESLKRNTEILNKINNSLIEKEWKLSYWTDLIMKMHQKVVNMDQQTAVVEKKEEVLTKNQKKNRKRRERLKHIKPQKANEKRRMKKMMRAIEHNVFYKQDEVDFERIDSKLNNQ